MDRIANYVVKGKYVLIDCWFSNCHPCRQLLPEIKEITEKLANKLIVVGFNYNDDKQVWLRALDELAITGVNLWAPIRRDGFCYKYGFLANPVFALINSDGEVLDIFYSSTNYGFLTQTILSFMDPEIPRPDMKNFMSCFRILPGENSKALNEMYGQ